MATAQKTPNNSYLGVIDISNPANLTIISSDLDRHVISKGYFYYGGVFSMLLALSPMSIQPSPIAL